MCDHFVQETMRGAGERAGWEKEVLSFLASRTTASAPERNRSPSGVRMIPLLVRCISTVPRSFSRSVMSFPR